MPGPNRNGLGDFEHKSGEPLETFYDIVLQGRHLPRRKWVVKPDWEPPRVEGMGQWQRFFEEHVIPRQWQLLADLWLKFQTGMVFVKRPNWIEPPVTARNLDIRTEDPVLLAAGGGPVVVKSFTIPDRWVGAILRLGHELTDAAFFGTVIWTLRINNRPVENYDRFKQQIGRFQNPTEIPIWPPLKTGDLVEWVADNPGPGNVSAFVRFWGFMFPAKMVTQDGSYRQYQTI